MPIDANAVSAQAAQIIETMNALEQELADIRIELRDTQDELGTVMENLTARIVALENGGANGPVDDAGPPPLNATLVSDASLSSDVVVVEGPPAPDGPVIQVTVNDQTHTASPGDTEFTFTEVSTSLGVAFNISQDGELILTKFFPVEDQTCGARITVIAG